MKSHQPNILIVVADTARADHLSCYGYARKTSPCIDRIAAEGCLFESAITPAPFSPAAYASIFSNLYPHQHGVNGDTVRIWPHSLPRLPQKLQDLGYHTFCVSNNDFVSEATHAHLGFDAFQGPRQSWLRNKAQSLTRRARKHLGDGAARVLADLGHRMFGLEKGDSADAVNIALDYIRRAGSKPFFGFVILMDPHAMYHPDRREFVTNAGAAKQFLKEINGPQMWAKLMARSCENPRSCEIPISHANTRESLPTDLFQAAMDFYDAEIKHADACIGTLYAALARSNKLDDTLLIVCADHGEAFGEHGVWGHGFCLNDCLTRVPLVMRCPKYFKPQTRSHALVPLHGLHDTCLNVAGNHAATANSLTRAADPTWTGHDAVFSEFPVQTQSLTMLRKLRLMGRRFSTGDQYRDREEADSDGGADHPYFHRWSQNMYAVRSRDWRYIEYDDGARELYDLKSDPGETQSVHENHSTVCRDLHARLAAHLGRETTGVGAAKHGVDDISARKAPRSDSSLPPIPTEPAPDTLDESVLNRLRALGYLD